MSRGARILLVPVAIVLGLLGVLAGPTEARADYPDQPSCVRVPLRDGTVRLYFDPGNTVKGDVVEARSGRIQFTERRDGVWIGTPDKAGYEGHWHFTWKSDARLFSERRGSGWIHCGKVTP